AVSGLSPQVLTETLYALLQRKGAIPDEVHLVTSSEGAERARLLLLSDTPGWFYRLCREYGLPEGCFHTGRIHVLRDAAGAPMSDIRTPEDNAAAADGIIAVVRELTANADSAIHASIAGGRKTMGFYLGYAMSLFGRPQDKLSHVLVAEPYESLPDFFFPTQKKEIIYTRDATPLDASQAQVWLAEIPFVRMRQGIPDALRKGAVSFSGVVEAASLAFQSPSLHIDLGQRQLNMAIGSLRLPPADLAFYTWLARLQQQGSKGVRCPMDAVANLEYGQTVVDIYRRIHNFGIGGHDRTERVLSRGMEKSYFEQRKSRINQALRLALGVNDSPYAILRNGAPGHYRFGLFG
ncbi:MAG: CRISPR-associated ring nuclease Csm6, partial [Mariprofundales bacterium]|nr:CRISPR-associated ring nuclease Csm6 [Mariprofundales bacterium]